MSNILKVFVILCAVCFSNLSISQDEVFFRKIFSGELLKKSPKLKPLSSGKYFERTPAYQFDMNRDGFFESLIVAKSDGADYLEIRDQNGLLMFRYKLQVNGIESHLFRIRQLYLTKQSKVFVLYFNEGYVDYVHFEGTGRYYFLTMENENLKTLNMKEGPSFWLEKQKDNFSYHQRYYPLEVKDLNGDGKRELVVGDDKIKQVFMYEGKGKWKSL